MNSPHILVIDKDESSIKYIDKILKSDHEDWKISDPHSDKEPNQMETLSPCVVFIASDIQNKEHTSTLISKEYPSSIRVLIEKTKNNEYPLKESKKFHYAIKYPFNENSLFELLTRTHRVTKKTIQNDIKELILNSSFISEQFSTYKEITRELDSKFPDIKVISETIKRDQALMSYIIRLANSPYFNFITQTSDIPICIMRLGLDTIKQIVFVHGTQQICSDNKDERYKTIQQESKEVTGLIGGYCDKNNISGITRQKAIVSGLLHNIGKLIHHHIAKKHSIQNLTEENSISVGSFFLELWGFEYEIIDAIENQRKMDPPNGQNQISYILNAVIKELNRH